MPHLTDAQVWSLVLGKVTQEQRAACEDHLAACGDCRAWLVALTAASSESTGPMDPEPPLRLRAGERVGRYFVVELIGAGGFGLVYSAFDPSLNRPVAIKVMRFRAETRQSSSERLLTEARLQARVTHPHVVAVYDSGTFRGDAAYVVMEQLEETLSGWLASPRSLNQLLDAFTQAGEGLSALHAAGIVHCDFKPDNVLMGADGRSRVGDFGLSLLDAVPANAGVRGTAAFLAPEVRAGEPLSHRSDQFSFCAAFSKALAGQRVPRAVLRVVARGLEPLPAQRFSSMRALLDALGRARQQQRRLRQVAAIGALAVLLVLAGAGRQFQLRSQCAQAPARAAQVWNGARESAVRQRFATVAPSLEPYASREVARALEVWSREWTSRWTSLCDAQAGLRDESWPDQRQCLETQLEDVASIVNTILTADTAPSDSANVSHLIPRAKVCETPARIVSPERPALRRDVRALETLCEFAKFAQVLSRGEALLQETSKGADLTLHARVLLSVGFAQDELGHTELAYQRYLDAFRAASEAHARELVAMAAIRLSTLHTRRGGAYEAGESYLQLARAQLDRERPSPQVLVAWHRTRALNASARSLWKEAVSGFSTVVHLQSEDPLVSPVALARSHANLAAARSQAGDTASAPEELAKARELMAAAVGPSNPDTLRMETMLANALYRRGQKVEAIDRTREVLERVTAANGDRLSVMQLQQNLGEMLLGVGDFQHAAQAYESSVKTHSEEGDDRYHLLKSYVGWAKALLGGHDGKAAFPVAERGYQLMARVAAQTPQPAWDGDACLVLGKAVWAARGDRLWANRLFAEARVHYGKLLSADAERTAELNAAVASLEPETRRK